MWNQLTINMKDVAVSKQPLNAEFKELGGRALIAQYMIKNVPPTCDPLGAENTLILCTTLFAGTSMTTAHRLSIGAKSPLTGGIKESNVGGYAAKLLAEQGIKLIEIKDLPTDGKLRLLLIDKDGTPQLLDAAAYAGLNNYELTERFQELYGKDIATITIGCAGERKYKAASIQVSEFGSGHPSRAAARGGIGSVMGSKGIKAIIIRKPETPYQPEYADRAAFDTAVKAINKMIATNCKSDPFHNIGTISTIETSSSNGILPVENFSGKLFKDYAEVGAARFMENLASRGGRNRVPCQPGCVVQCSNVYNDADGNYLTSGFEYETVALFGPNCRITDLDAIARMDRICDDIGVDTIDVACAVAVCMENNKLDWGDADGTLALLNEIKDGTEFGSILGNGCEATGLALNAKRIPVVKHQALAGYDPRNTKGTGITYITSPMGADHTAGLTMGRAFDDAGRAGQAYASNKLQVVMSFADSMMCIFAFANCVPGVPLLADMMTALYGSKYEAADLMKLGITTFLTEKKYNTLAGMTSEDDKLPDFFYEERCPGTGSKFDIIQEEIEAIFAF